MVRLFSSVSDSPIWQFLTLRAPLQQLGFSLAAFHKVSTATLMRDMVGQPHTELTDDHVIFRAVMVYLNSAIEILGVAYDGPDLVAEASRLRPEVNIVEVAMPVLYGLDAARNPKPCFLGRGSSF